MSGMSESASTLLLPPSSPGTEWETINIRTTKKALLLEAYSEPR